MAALEILTVLSFAEQFLGVLQKLIRDTRQRKQFQDDTIFTVCEAFDTETEARFVVEKFLVREDVVRLLISPATSSRKQELLEIFRVEVEQAGLAQWHDFSSKAEGFIDRTVEIQLKIFGTLGEAASTNILGRKIDNLQKVIEEFSKPSSTREDYLAKVLEESRQNCIARWEAAGLTYELAQELADDTSIGAPNSDLRSRFEQTTIWFIGEFGLGKSLLMERLFQEAVIDSFENEHAPIPIFLRARDIASESLRLEEIVKTRAASLNLKTQQVLVFVDGVDEASRNFAENLKIDVRTLQALRSETRVFIASRTLPNTQLSKNEQAIVLPKLGEAERLALMSRVSGQEIIGRYHFYSSPAALRGAIEVPLFAILMANYLRKRDFHSVLSTGELIHSLVEQSLEQARAEIEGGFERLKSLALLTIERDRAINSREIGSWREVQALLKTRLVVERDGAIEFPLPILGQWFAAQGLTSGDFPIQRLLSDGYLLEQWRYPLVVFVATNPFEAVQKILGPIIEQQPAFASSIISESLTQSVGTLPRAHEAGHKLREAMQVWINGLGPLSSLIAPVSDDGAVRPIRVATNEGLLSYSWYAGKETVADIQIIHNHGVWNAQSGLLSRDWPNISNLREGKQLAWPWRVTLNELSRSLGERLKKRGLPIVTKNNPIWEEAVWQLALKLTKKGSRYSQPLEFADVLHDHLARHEYWARQGQQYFVRGEPNFETLQQLKLGLGNRLFEGIVSPWPGPDRTWGESGHWVWSPYSDKQILVRTQAVYAAALAIYQHLVETWFASFAARLSKYALLPVRLIGIVIPPSLDPEDDDVGPIMDYYLEPLSSREQTHVDIKLLEEGDERQRNRWSDLDFFQERREHVKLLRPEASNWITLTTTGTLISDVFLQARPATEIAYEWLWDDLKKVSWVDGNLGRNYRDEEIVFSLSNVLE